MIMRNIMSLSIKVTCRVDKEMMAIEYSHNLIEFHQEEEGKIMVRIMILCLLSSMERMTHYLPIKLFKAEKVEAEAIAQELLSTKKCIT